MSLISKVYINGIYQGQTTGTTWNTSQIYTTPPTPFGAGYYLPMKYSVKMYWRVDVYNTETELTTIGNTWTFYTQSNPFSPSSQDGETEDPKGTVWDSLLEEWVEDFDVDDSWQFVDGEYQWTALPDVKGGGRYRNSLLAFGIDINGLGNISINT